MIAGIDEAGRGPALGPMVMACVVFEPEQLQALESAGVKDSKALTPAARERLSRIIRTLARGVYIRSVEPREIDLAVSGVTDKNLNYLEARIAAELILKTPDSVRVVYLDSPDPNPQRFASMVRKAMGNRREWLRIVAENNADQKYVVVSAASIVAKVERDRAIQNLKKVYGDFGSGYPSDPRTRAFLERWISEHGSPPPFARTTWSTVKKLLKRRSLS